MTTAAATPAIKEDRILILDFGSQYSQLNRPPCARFWGIL